MITFIEVIPYACTRFNKEFWNEISENETRMVLDCELSGIEFNDYKFQALSTFYAEKAI